MPALRRKVTGDKFKNGPSGSWRGCTAGDGRGVVESRSLFFSPAVTPLNLSTHAVIYESSMPAIFLNLAWLPKPPLNEKTAKFFQISAAFCHLPLSGRVKDDHGYSAQAWWGWSEWLWGVAGTFAIGSSRISVRQADPNLWSVQSLCKTTLCGPSLASKMQVSVHLTESC